MGVLDFASPVDEAAPGGGGAYQDANGKLHVLIRPAAGHLDFATAVDESAPEEAQPAKLPDPGGLASAAQGFVNGATFGFAPRMRAGVRSALGMGNYDDELAAANESMAAAEQNHPILTGAGNLVGAIASPVSKAGAIMKGAGLGAKVINGIGQGAIAGGLFGASQSENLGDVGDVAGNAAKGAGIGAGLGMVIAPAAAGIGKVAGAVANRASNRTAGKALNVPTASAAKVGDALQQDVATGSFRSPAMTPGVSAAQAIQTVLSRHGLTTADLSSLSNTETARIGSEVTALMRPASNDGDMLMNLGPQLAGRAEAIATQPGEGSNILLDASKRQAAGEGSRIKAVVDRSLGSDQGRVLDAAAVDAERKAAGSQIKAAKSHRGHFDLAQTTTDLDAKIAAADGPVAAILAQARKLKVFDGQPKTAEQLHQARMALDDMLEKAGSDPATSAGRNAKAALGEVRSAIDAGLKTVPGMKQADAAFASAMKSKQALMDGRDVFTRSFGSPEELEAELNAMDPGVRARFLKGARDAISVMMGTSRNDAAAVQRELLQKGWNKEKLEILVGPQTAGVIERALEQSANRASGRTMLSGNSRTAMRQAGQKEFPGPVEASGVADKVAGKSISGIALSMLVAVANKASGGLITSAINKSRAATSTGAAKLLSSEGATRDEVLRVLNDAQKKAGRALNAKEQIAAVTQAFSTRAAVPSVVGANHSEARP